MHKVVPFGSCCSENSSSIPTNWFHGFLFSVCHLKVPDHIESELLMAENKPLIVETIFFLHVKITSQFSFGLPDPRVPWKNRSFAGQGAAALCPVHALHVLRAAAWSGSGDMWRDSVPGMGYGY